MKPTQEQYEKIERKKCRAKKSFETWLAAFKFAGAIWWAQKKSLNPTIVLGAGNGIWLL